MSPAAIKSSPRRAESANPRASDHSGAFGSDVIAALRHLAQMISERPQFWPSRGEQRFAVER
jgi:hypothetical protein